MDKLDSLIIAAADMGDEALQKLVEEMRPLDILDNYELLVSNGVKIDLAKLASSSSIGVDQLDWYIQHDHSTLPILRKAGADWVYTNHLDLLHQGVKPADLANALAPWQLNECADLLYHCDLQLCELRSISATSIPALVRAGYGLWQIVDRIAEIDMQYRKTNTVSTAIYLMERQSAVSSKAGTANQVNKIAESIRQPEHYRGKTEVSLTTAQKMHSLDVDVVWLIHHMDILDAVKLFGMNQTPEVQEALYQELDSYTGEYLAKHIAELTSHGISRTHLIRKLGSVTDVLIGEHLADFLDEDCTADEATELVSMLADYQPNTILDCYTQLQHLGANVDIRTHLHRYLTLRGYRAKPVSSEEFMQLCQRIEMEQGGQHIPLANFPDNVYPDARSYDPSDEDCRLVDCDRTTINFLIERGMSPHRIVKLIDPWAVIEISHWLRNEGGITADEISHAIVDWYSQVERENKKKFNWHISRPRLVILLNTDNDVDLSPLGDCEHVSLPDVLRHYSELKQRGLTPSLGQDWYHLSIQLVADVLDNLVDERVTVEQVLHLVYLAGECTPRVVRGLIRLANGNPEQLTRIAQRAIDSNLDGEKDMLLLELLQQGADANVVAAKLSDPRSFADLLLQHGADPSGLLRTIELKP